MIYYFTCGQKHTHFLENGKRWDKNGVISVEAKNRDTAINFVYEEFGQSWGDVFTDESDVDYFFNGIVGEYKA